MYIALVPIFNFFLNEIPKYILITHVKLNNHNAFYIYIYACKLILRQTKFYILKNKSFNLEIQKVLLRNYSIIII